MTLNMDDIKFRAYKCFVGFVFISDITTVTDTVDIQALFIS